MPPTQPSRRVGPIRRTGAAAWIRSGRGDAAADHLSLRLRLRGRVRGRLPGGDRADRAGRPADRPQPRDRSTGHPPGRDRCSPTRSPPARPACISRWSIRALARSAGRSRSRAAEGRFLVGPDNGLLSRALERLGGALERRRPHALALPTRAGARRPSTGVTCSRPSPRTWRSGRGSRRLASRSTRRR